MSVESLISLAEGAATTVWLSLLGISLGMPIGMGIALIRVQRIPILWQILAVYVSLARATPVVTLVLLIYFGLPALGIELSPHAAALAAIVGNSAPFQSEVWRASFMAFPKGQLDAAKSAGMRPMLAMRRIVLPQAWRMSLPGLMNEATFLVKTTPAIAVIGVVDLTRAAVRISSYTYDPVTPFLSASIIYVLAIACLVKIQRALEKMTMKEYGAL